MKYIISMIILCIFSLPGIVFASDDAFDTIKKAWEARRTDGVENTLWRVQDYKQKSSCADVSELSCYKKDGEEKHLAQSLSFESNGSDGIWLHFFAPRGVKNKGAVVQLDTDDIADSPRFFCRGKLARGGARRITTPVSDQDAIDSSVNFSWAMMLMQTGEISSDKLFTFSKNDGAITAKAMGDMPSHRLYIDDGAITRIDFLDDEGEILWIVKNKVNRDGNKWHPIETFVADVAKGEASLMNRDDKLRFKKWPRSYNKNSLPCGR